MPGRLTFGRRSAKEETISLRRHTPKPINRNETNSIVDYAKVHDLAELDEITLQNGILITIILIFVPLFGAWAGPLKP